MKASTTIVFPSVKCYTQTKRRKSITLLRKKSHRLSILSKHENNEQYLKTEFILLRRQMGEMFCHFFVELLSAKSLFYQFTFFLAFLLWPNIEKEFVENARTQCPFRSNHASFDRALHLCKDCSNNKNEHTQCLLQCLPSMFLYIFTLHEYPI